MIINFEYKGYAEQYILTFDEDSFFDSSTRFEEVITTMKELADFMNRNKYRFGLFDGVTYTDMVSELLTQKFGCEVESLSDEMAHDLFHVSKDGNCKMYPRLYSLEQSGVSSFK